MKFRKFAAAAAAVAVLGAAAPVMGLTNPLGVTASAAEVKLQLISENNVYPQRYLWDDVNNGSTYWVSRTTGFGYEFGGVSRLGRYEFERFRDGGGLSMTLVSNGDDEEFVPESGHGYFAGNSHSVISGNTYSEAINLGENNTIKYLYPEEYYISWGTDSLYVHKIYEDGGSDTVVKIPQPTVEKNSYSSFSVNHDGYIMVTETKESTETYNKLGSPKSSKTHIKLYNPAGTLIKEFDQKGSFCEISIEKSNEDHAFIFYVRNYDDAVGELYSMDESGKTNLLYSDSLNLSLVYAPIDMFDFGVDNGELYIVGDKVYYLSTGEEYDVRRCSGGRVYNKKTYVGYDEGGSHVLYDLQSGELPLGKGLGDFGVSTNDGEIFLATPYGGDKKTKILDRNGNELGKFDYVAPFIGDYTLVSDDNLLFLIDRKMNRVSEKFDFRNSDVGYIMTGGIPHYSTDAKIKGVDSIIEGVYSADTDDGIFYVTSSGISYSAPAVPENVKADSTVSSDSVSLSWDGVSGATGYVIQYSNDGGKNWKTLETIKNAITINSLTPGFTYTYRIAAKKDDVIGTYSPNNTFDIKNNDGTSDPDNSTDSDNPNTSDITHSPDDPTPENPNTGVIFGFAAIAISGAAVLVSRKKHR